MAKKDVVRIGEPCVHGLHTMSPTIDRTVHHADGSTSRVSTVCKVELSPTSLYLRYLHDAESGACLGSFVEGWSDQQVKLF